MGDLTTQLTVSEVIRVEWERGGRGEEEMLVIGLTASSNVTLHPLLWGEGEEVLGKLRGLGRWDRGLQVVRGWKGPPASKCYLT